MKRRRTRNQEQSVHGSSACSFETGSNPASSTQQCERWCRRTPGFSPSSLGKVQFPFCETFMMGVSEKDEKILTLMVARRQAEIHETELAFAVQTLWHEQKLLEKKKVSEKAKALSENLEKKRAMDRFLNSKRRTARVETISREAVALEKKITEELERAEGRQRLAYEKKVESQKKRSFAKGNRQRCLKEEKAYMETMERSRYLISLEAKERKNKENLERSVSERRRRTLEESSKRDLKMETAKLFREESNRQISEDQKRKFESNRKLEEIRAEKAKMARIQQEKTAEGRKWAKQRQHDLLLLRVEEEAADKTDRARRKIEEKEVKMRIFKEKKAMEIEKGKLYARKTANLRQQIQTCYNP